MKIIVADCSPLYRQGMEIVLNKMKLAAQIIPVACYESLEDEVDLQQGELTLIVDYRLPGLNDLSELKALIDEHDLAAIVLTDFNDPVFMRWALVNGVKAAISKTSSVEDLQSVIFSVLNNEELFDVESLEVEQDEEPWIDPIAA